MMKKLTLIILFLMMIPVALADSVFSNPAFDVVLVLIFAVVIFLILREVIKKIK